MNCQLTEGELLTRWTEYVKAEHGGNVRIKELKDADSNRCHDFQFSILQILPKPMVKEDVIKVESLWKNKLYSLGKPSHKGSMLLS